MSLFSTSNSKNGAHDPLKRGLIAFFLAILVATALADTFFPAPPPKLIGRERGADERLRKRAKLWDGTQARLLERDLRLTSRVRRSLGSYYAFGLYYLFGEAQGSLLVGKDDWLFLPGRADLPERDNHDVAERAAARLTALQRRLKSYGIHLVPVPIPRKSALYREHLPPGVRPHAELDRMLADALRERGVRTADLWSIYQRYRKEHPERLLYFQAGSHWTELAEILAAREICRVTLGKVPENPRLMARGSEPQEHDLLRYIGLHVSGRWINLLGLPEVEAFEVESRPAEEPRPTSGAEKGRPGRLALTGTSFSALRNFPRFLEHCADEHVWNAAEAGSAPLASLLAILRSPRGPLPEVIVAEMPNHNVIGQSPLPLADTIFMEFPPAAQAPVLHLRRLEFPEKNLGKHQEVSRKAWLHLAKLPAGALLHSGDGVAALRLRGRVEGRLRLRIEDPRNRWDVRWPKKKRELILPLTSPVWTGSRLRVFLSGSGSIELEGADLIASLDEERAVSARYTRVTERDGGWRQRLIFPERPVIADHGALFLEFHVEGELESAELRLWLITEDGPQKERSLAPLRPQSLVLISLAPYRLKKLLAVEVRGAGSPPRRVIRRALLLPPSLSQD